MKEFTITANDGLEISAALFECESPKAAVQIIHGAKEHKERYYDLCEFLAANGYAVIVTDNRGHGASVNDDYPLGHFDSVDAVIDDQYTVTQYIKSLYPDKKLYMYGHSLGSLFARIYLAKHDDEIEKLLLTGTVLPVPAASAGAKICGVSEKLWGKKLAKGVANKIANSDNDKWVCKNPSTMIVYRKDPLVKGCIYTNAAVRALVEAAAAITNFDRFEFKNPSLRIFSATGSEDPCTGGSLGLKASLDALYQIGYTCMKTKVYPGMKHEVINERGNAEVYNDILDFFDK